MRKFLRGRGALLIVVALLVSVVIGLCSRAFGIDPLGGVLHTLATPVRGGINAVVNWAEGVYNYIFNYQEMEDELTELRRSVARMEDELRQGREASREILIAEMVKSLEAMDKTLLDSPAAMLDRYRSDCITLGKAVSILRGDEVRHATALDIDAEGGLIVRYDSGEVAAVTSGEVSVRGLYGYL